MKKSAIFSGVLHLLFIIALIIGIPTFQQRVVVQEQPILMEFTNIGEKTAAPKLSPVNQNEEPKKQKPPKKEKVEEEKPKVEEQLPPEPEQKKEPEPEPVKEEKPKPEPIKEPEPEPIPEKKPEPKPKKKPEPKKEEKKPEPKKEEKKPEPKKKDDSKKKDTKDKKKTMNQKAEVNIDPKKKNKAIDDVVDNLINESLDSGGDVAAPASEVGAEITGTEIDAIRQRIYKCWIVPMGVRDAKDLVVDIEMDIAKDGTVKKAEVVNKARMKEPYFQAAAESAQRAVLDPKCNPLPLPPEKYEQWKKLTLRFNPKDMY